MDDVTRIDPADDPSWLPPEDLTDEELGTGQPLHPELVARYRRRAREARERWRRLADTPVPEAVTVTPESVGTVLRALRWRARFNQRELAAAAGVPSTTVDRLERAEVSDPKLSTLVALTQACGLRLAVVDDEGTRLAVPWEQVRFRDGADRRLPAHLPTFDPRVSGWWGDGRYRRHGQPIRRPVRASQGRRRTGGWRDGVWVDVLRD